jgi:uncharacterized RDD family membrane protein YckC
VVFVDRISVTTPERVVVEHDVAGVGSRAVAQLIDFCVLVGMVSSLSGVVVNGTSILPAWLHIPLIIVASAASPFVYFILFEWLEGATPGKLALRIRVLTDQGAPIGLRASATRNILRVVDFLPVFYVLGGIVATCSARSQRLGDMAAGTVAVRVPRSGPGAAPSSRRPGTFVDLIDAERPTTATPPEVGDVVDEFLRRRKELGTATRVELAGTLAGRLEPYVERPDAVTDEEYIEQAGKVIQGA